MLFVAALVLLISSLATWLGGLLGLFTATTASKLLLLAGLMCFFLAVLRARESALRSSSRGGDRGGHDVTGRR